MSETNTTTTTTTRRCEPSTEPPDLPPPLRERDLRELATCAICAKKVGEGGGLPIVWRVRAERHALDPGAIRRQTGLAMLLGGNGALAMHMGPDEPMTLPLGAFEVGVCERCVMERAWWLLECIDEETLARAVERKGGSAS